MAQTYSEYITNRHRAMARVKRVSGSIGVPLTTDCLAHLSVHELSCLANRLEAVMESIESEKS